MQYMQYTYIHYIHYMNYIHYIHSIHHDLNKNYVHYTQYIHYILYIHYTHYIYCTHYAHYIHNHIHIHIYIYVHMTSHSLPCKHTCINNKYTSKLTFGFIKYTVWQTSFMGLLNQKPQFIKTIFPCVLWTFNKPTNVARGPNL